MIEVPGHTSGHVAYWFEEEDLLFTGDTLFAMGCGRGFEEPPQVLFHSLMKLAALPGETTVYCGHEYTLANAKFALTVEPGNGLLQERAAEVAQLRAEGKFTLPTTIALECADQSVLARGRAGCSGGGRPAERRSRRGVRRIARAQEPRVKLMRG